jgi:hypothetical protein
MKHRNSRRFTKLKATLLLAVMVGGVVLSARSGFRAEINAAPAAPFDAVGGVDSVLSWVMDEAMAFSLAALAGALRRRRLLLVDMAVGLLQSSGKEPPAAASLRQSLRGGSAGT